MNIITTIEQLHEMINHYKTVDAFAFDVETVGDRRGDTPINEVLWITFSTYGRGDVIPMGHPNGDLISEVYPLTTLGKRRSDLGLQLKDGDYSKDRRKATQEFGPPPKQLSPHEVFPAIRELMFNPSILKVGHNLVFDLTSVAKYFDGQFPVGPYFDTMVGSFIYDNRNKNRCGLDDCLNREFAYTMVKGVGKEVEKYTFNEVAQYAYLDAKYTFLLWKSVKAKLEEANLLRTMALEMDVLEVLCSMKLTGAPIDEAALKDLADTLEKNIEEARASIYRIAQQVFNINSNAEKQFLLFAPKDQGGRGLKPKILTPKGEQKDEQGKELTYSDYSVSAEALATYAGKDPLVDALLQYAELNKLYSTYVIPYIGGEVVHTVQGKEKREYKSSLLINGRVHGDFVQHGAETGRFSSRNPNLQNIPNPSSSEVGKAIRDLFYAPPGYKLVVADYSQIEPRIIASMSKDPIMMKNYLEGGDIYTTVGTTMGVDRKAGKVLVLSMAYGVGPDKISRQIGCSVKDARDLLDNFSKKFSSVNKYRRKIIGAAKSVNPPYVATVLSRKRYLPGITSKQHDIRSQAERQAFNTRIQGSAADIMKLAMVRAYKALPEYSKIILTVHDELVTLCPEDKADETVEIIREAMEGINLLDVPLVADIKVVDRWGQAK